MTNSTNSKNRLTQAERLQFSLPQNKKDILIGLLLGDVFAEQKTQNSNAVFWVTQGLVHQDYLMHLFELFKDYCQTEPKITTPAPDKRTGKSYPTIRFITRALPCFNELYKLFYPKGKKVVPKNIADLLTTLSLAFWIADDGSFEKSRQRITLSTQGFTKADVELLAKTLNGKWNLNCAIYKNGNGFIIRIPKRSLPVLQDLLKDIMPSMMKHKIGL